MMFLELIFSDVDSLYDYLKHYSCGIARELFVTKVGSMSMGYPFIWYSPLMKEYHIDVRVNHRLEAYGNLPRRKWEKLNEDTMLVLWEDSKNLYSENAMRMRMFDDNWRWTDEALCEVMLNGEIYAEFPSIYSCGVSAKVNIYKANKYREYIPMFKPSIPHSTRFELSFQSISDLEKYLCAYENDSRMEFVMHVDPHETYRRYPLVIHRKPLYDGQPDTYLVDVYAKDELATHASRYRAEIRKIETVGNYAGEPSPKWYVKTDTYGFFQMHEGRYKWRTYKPKWNLPSEDLDDLSVAFNCSLQNEFLKQAKKELRDKFIKNGIVKGSDVNKALGLDSHTCKIDNDEIVTVSQSFKLNSNRNNRFYKLDDHLNIDWDSTPELSAEESEKMCKTSMITFDEKYDHCFERIGANFGVPKDNVKEMFDKAKDEMEKYFGATEDRDKAYIIMARGNGKSTRQMMEAFKQYMLTGKPTVVVSPKSFYGICSKEPAIRFEDLDEKTLKYVDTDVNACVEYYSIFNEELKKDVKERMNIMFGVDLNKIPEIKDVKFNNPATIVFWADGTKTVVKRQKGDRFDKEKGLAMAIVKKLFGNKGNYNELFKKWIKEDK